MTCIARRSRCIRLWKMPVRSDLNEIAAQQDVPVNDASVDTDTNKLIDLEHDLHRAQKQMHSSMEDASAFRSERDCRATGRARERRLCRYRYQQTHRSRT